MKKILIFLILSFTLACKTSTQSIQDLDSKGIYYSLQGNIFKIDYDGVLNANVTLRPFSRSSYIDGLLPNTGVIEKRNSFSDEKDWYFIKLNVHVVDSDFCNGYVLVRPRYRKKPIVKTAKVIVALYLIPNKDLITNARKSREDFIFRGWAVLENVNVETEV